MNQKPHCLANFKQVSENPGKWTYRTIDGKFQTQNGKLLSWTDGVHETHTIHLDWPFNGDPADVTLLIGELSGTSRREVFEVVFDSVSPPDMETIYCVNSRKPV